MANITPEQLRTMLLRRLPNANANVLTGDELNSSEVIQSGRIFALIEFPQDSSEPWDPIVSARMAVDKNGRLRAIVLQTKSEREHQDQHGSPAKSGKEKTD